MYGRFSSQQSESRVIQVAEVRNALMTERVVRIGFDECHDPRVIIGQHIEWKRVRYSLTPNDNVEANHSGEDENELAIESNIVPQSNSKSTIVCEEKIAKMNRTSTGDLPRDDLQRNPHRILNTVDLITGPFDR